MSQQASKKTPSQLMFSAPVRAGFEFPRVLKYRKKARTDAYVFLWAGIVAIFDGIYEASLGGSFLNQACAAIFLCCAFAHHWRSFFGVSVQVFEDRVEVTKNGQRKIVPFSNVTAIETVPTIFRFLGTVRFNLKTTQGETHYFTSDLERPEYVLDAAMLCNAKLMSAAAYSDLRERLLFADHKHARGTDIVSGVHKKYFYAQCLFGGLFCGALVRLSLQTLQDAGVAAENYIYARIGFAVACMVFISAGSILLERSVMHRQWHRRYAADPKDKIRDIEAEAGVMKWSTYGVGTVYFLVLAALYQTSFLAYGYTRSGNDAPGLQVRQGEWFLLDYRASCKKCPQRLQVGSLVSYVDAQKANRIGRVVAVAGEAISLPDGSTVSRELASSSVVPDGQVAVRVNPDGAAIVLMPLDQIIGSMHRFSSGLDK